MSYQQMAVPPRSAHLWRYTPWPRIHPTKVEELPEADGISFTVEGHEKASFTRDDISSDIARVFLQELKGSSQRLTINGTGETVHVHARASGHVAVGHLDLTVKGDATVLVHLTGESGWCGLHITGTVHPNANLGFGFINELDANTKLLRCDDWIVERDASFESATLSVGGFKCKSDLRTTLNGTGSSIRQAVTAHGQGTRHDDHHIEIHHLHGHTDSDLVTNAACSGSSHFVATGLLTIAEGADGSDAGQVFRNLLLSEKARAEAIPELEVLADDVSAAHGAASAPINPSQLHYLMSRGLSLEESESMIVNGFLIDAFSNLKNDALTEQVRTRLTVHLECELKR
jgi:Fe-S cluster assembly protein SufD